MKVDDFVVPQQRLCEWNYYLQNARLQSAFSDDLKKLLKSTTNISSTPETTTTSQKLKEIFMSHKEKALNENIFSITGIVNIVQDSFFI